LNSKSLITYIIIGFSLSAFASSIDAEIIKDIEFFEMMSILEEEEEMDIEFENIDLEGADSEN
jgi:hypothetical protein